RRGGSVSPLKRSPPGQIPVYGVGAPEGEPAAPGLVSIPAMVEKPAPADAPSDLAIMGRYVLTPAVFDAIDNLEPGAVGELQLTDAMAALIGKEPFSGLVFTTGRYDTGNKLDWLKATVEVALTHHELGKDFREALTELVRREGIV